MTHDHERQISIAVAQTAHAVMSMTSLDPSSRKLLTTRHREQLELASRVFAEASAFLSRCVDEATPKE